MAAVLAVEVLDDLLATVALDVDVDVRGAVALGRQEALEQQAERHGIGGGDAEGVADRRVRRRAAALAVDVLPPTELDEVPDDEEVAGEAETLDDVELTVDRLPRPRPQREVLVGRGTFAVAAAPTFFDDVAQVGHLAQGRGAGERRQRRGDELEVERCGAADLGGELDRPGVAGEATLLLPAGAQVRAGGGGQPGIELGEAAP